MPQSTPCAVGRIRRGPRWRTDADAVQFARLHLADVGAADEGARTQVFRVIRYDQRGHDKSSVPPGPYSVERFGRDMLAILDDLNIEKVHWCGLSMGGMVGRLSANASERFGKIILANTTCYWQHPDRPTGWKRHQGGQGRRHGRGS